MRWQQGVCWTGRRVRAVRVVRRVLRSFAALRMTAKTHNSKGDNKGSSRDPLRDDSEKSSGKSKYRGLSTARRTVRLSAASVEMTFRICCNRSYFARSDGGGGCGGCVG